MSTEINLKEVEKVISNGIELNGFDGNGFNWRKPLTITIKNFPKELDYIKITIESTDTTCQTVYTETIKVKEASTISGFHYGDKVNIYAHIYMQAYYEYKEGSIKTKIRI